MDDFAYVFDAWRKWSCKVVCVWPRTNSDTIISMFIKFCYLEWMTYESKLIWCDLLTSKIWQVEGTVLVSVRIFVNKINTYRLKRWYYEPRAKLLDLFTVLATGMAPTCNWMIKIVKVNKLYLNSLLVSIVWACVSKRNDEISMRVKIPMCETGNGYLHNEEKAFLVQQGRSAIFRR